MSDIWSGIGVEISKVDGEWLFRVGSEIRGPVPQKVLIDKLLSGEIGLTTLVAKEGGEFHPIAQIKLFATHVQQAKKLAAQRAAGRTRRIVLFVVLLVAAGGAVAGYFIWEAHKQAVAAQERERQEKLAELERQRKEREAVGDLGLVALVSLGKEEEVKIRGEPRRVTKIKGSRELPEPTGPGKEPETFVSSCERSVPSILAELGRHVGKLNVCVQEEKKGPQGNLLPERLEIEFVVTPEGKVVDFAVANRHYRTGLLKNCMTKVFMGIRYPPAKGSNCPVTLPINIGK